MDVLIKYSLLGTILLLVAQLPHSSCQDLSYPSDKTDDCSRLPSYCYCTVSSHVVCDCQHQSTSELLLSNNMTALRRAQNVTVQNCERVAITGNTFQNSSVQQLILVNITRLALSERAVTLRQREYRRFSVTMLNVATDKLPSHFFTLVNRDDRRVMDAADNQYTKVNLVISHAHIGTLSAEVFDNVNIHNLIILNSTIGVIETNFLNNTIIEGSITFVANNISRIESNAITCESEHSSIFKFNNFIERLDHFLTLSSNFNIEICNNSFPVMTIAPWTLHAREDVVIENNHFTNMPNRGIDIVAGARFSFSWNKVQRMQTHALYAIKTKDSSTLVQINGNSFQTMEVSSLLLPLSLLSDAVIIRDNVIEQQCSCNITTVIAAALGTNLTIQMMLQHRQQAPWLVQSLCLGTATLQATNHIRVWRYHLQNCVPADLTTTVFLICFACALITLACCVIIAWRRLRDKHMADTHSTSVQPQYPGGDISGSRVMPEKRMYRETEIHVLFQQAREISDSDNNDYGNDGFVEHNDEELPTPKLQQQQQQQLKQNQQENFQNELQQDRIQQRQLNAPPAEHATKSNKSEQIEDRVTDNNDIQEDFEDS